MSPDGPFNVAGRDLYTAEQQNFYDARPTYELTPFPVAAPAPPRSVGEAPSRLLSARYRLVPFSGRDGELHYLAEWRDDNARLGVRLVHGPGGQGKTRLAARFAALSAAVGWAVWTARQEPSLTAAASLPVPVAGRGVLVLIDYAERWPLADLFGLLGDRRLPTGAPVRVLLLARPAGAWWASLSHRLNEQDVAVSELRLEPVEASGTSRAELFTAAAARFADLLGVDPAAVSVPAGLTTDDAFRLVLTTHMAALVAVDAARTARSVPVGPAGLSSYLLDRERDHWQRLHHEPGAEPIGTPPRVMGRAVFTATLTRPLPYADAVEVLARVGIATGEETAARVLADHTLCYPAADPTLVLEPLYPDRLGEDFLALCLPGGGEPDPWAADGARRLVATDRPPLYLGRALTVLIETAKRWPHVGALLSGLLVDRLDLVIAGGGPVLIALASWSEVDAGLLEGVERLFPAHRHVDLDAGIAAITHRLHAYRITSTTDPAHTAYLHEQLAYRLHHAGLRAEALTVSEQAVEIRRRLAAVNPAAFEPDLARSLNNLGNRLSGVGRRAEALTATEQSVEIRRRLAAVNPAAFEPDLAASLDNLGIWLSGVGRRAEALTATEQSVEILRRLAAVTPAAFEPNLARSLDNLGIRLSGVGRRAEALTATEQSVEIYRRLAAVNPAAFEPDLAASLSNLGADLSDLGRRAEALTATEQAVEIRRRLAAVNPAAFEPDLARSLSNLGALLSNLGRREEALTAAQEAEAIRQRGRGGSPSAGRSA